MKNSERFVPEEPLETQPVEHLDQEQPQAEQRFTPGELVKKAFDTHLIVYKVLNPTNANDARKEFLEKPELTAPNFEYGNVDPDKVAENLEIIQALYGEGAKLPRFEGQIFKVLVDNSAKQNAFVESCIEYNAAKTPEEKAQLKEAHRFANEALYGAPDEATFYSLLSEQLAKIDLTNLTPEDKVMYDSLVADLGEMKTFPTGKFVPKPETVQRFSEMFNMVFGHFWSHIPEDKDEFTTQEACAIVNDIFREEFDGETEYSAKMDDTISNISVDHDNRVILFPVNRALGNFSRQRLKEIIAHEICTHAYRATIYEEHEIEVLSNGLPGNSEIDEGIAKCCEQAVAGKYSESGVEHYINIGLANFKGKNFREVFDIQRRLLYLKGCKAGETPEEKQARFYAKDADIFRRTLRCFRGTGELPNNKDLVYYNGSNRIWRFIEENIDDPDLMDKLFLSGKSDILNPDQERLMYETKI